MGCGAKCNVGIITVSLTALVILSFFTIFLINPVSAKKCPGRCISNTTLCKLKGGKIAGYCTNEMACCDCMSVNIEFEPTGKIGTCGSTMNNLTTAYFRSPDYPDYSSGDLICQFDFIFNTNAVGIVVEFTEIKMDGSGFVKDSGCESDMIFFKGFPDWTPPAKCGNLTNYAAVIELGEYHTEGMTYLTLLAIMSSPKYIWNLKVTQLYPDPKKNGSDSSPTMKKPSPDDYADSEEDYNEYDDYDIEGRSAGKNSSSPSSNDKKQLKLDNPKISNSKTHAETEEEEILRVTRIARLMNPQQLTQTASASVDYAYIQEGMEQQDFGEVVEEEAFIVNGNETQISSVPWQASLRSKISRRLVKLLPSLGIKNCSISEGLHFCGGSIISDRHILSAVHCFALGEKLSTWQPLNSMKVVLGDSNLCDESKEGIQEFTVDKVYYHYGYDNSVILNDVVIIKLKEKIKFTKKIKPIKLAPEESDFDQRMAMASGWGLTNLTGERRKSKPEQLQYANDLFIGNRSYCSKQQMKLYPSMRRVELIKYPKYINVFNSLLCTQVRNGSVARVVGQGDSGGPLVVYPEKSKNAAEEGESQKEPVLAGVISYMIPIPKRKRPHDVSNYVDFYQSVSFFRNWIELAMR